VSMSPSTGHVDVKTIGGNDGTALANRRPKHRHTVTDPGHIHGIPAATAGTSNAAGTATAAGTPGENTFSATTGISVGGASDPLDTAAYLVGGIWVIKALA
jgi:hypothetical protein